MPVRVPTIGNSGMRTGVSITTDRLERCFVKLLGVEIALCESGRTARLRPRAIPAGDP